MSKMLRYTDLICAIYRPEKKQLKKLLRTETDPS